MQFKFEANLEKIAKELDTTRDAIGGYLRSAVENLSISTHAFVVTHAQEKLKGWQRDHFFGENGRNVRWTEVAEGFWVVEIDPSVAWIEEGRDPTFMGEWLLKGDNVKTAKDGSRYRVIPFTHSRGSKIFNQDFVADIKEAAQKSGFNLKTIDKDADGNPKTGILGKLNFGSNVTTKTDSNSRFFSKERGPSVAESLGLKTYSGKHYLSDAVVTQRKVGKSFKKEVVTFRVISSKHEGEGRWFYPEVQALNSIPAAYDYATREWDKIMRSLEVYLAGR